MIEPLLPSFVEMVGKTHLRRPTIPFLSNLSGDWITPSEATDPNYWGKHLRGTVRFGEGLSELLSKPANILLEVGPGETLTTLAQRHPDKNPEQAILSSLPHPGKAQMALQHFFLTLGKLWLNGVNIKWENFYAEERRNRVSLPAYPFERLSYWVKPKTGNASDSMTAVQGLAEGHGLSISSLDEWFYAPSWRRSERPVLRDAFAGKHGSVVVFTDEHYIGPALITRLRTYGIKPIVVVPDLAFRREDEDFYTVRPGHRQDYDLLLAVCAMTGEPLAASFICGVSTEVSESGLRRRAGRGIFSACFILRKRWKVTRRSILPESRWKLRLLPMGWRM